MMQQEDFREIFERIKSNHNGKLADNTASELRWQLSIAWDALPLENPMVQKAVASAKFKQYYRKWYERWQDKSIDGKVECFEAALISFMGHVFKSAVEKLSNGDVRVLDFVCASDQHAEKFDYITCPFDDES